MSIRRCKQSGKWKIDVTKRSLGIRVRRTADTREEAKSIESEIIRGIQSSVLPDAGIEQALVEYLKTEGKLLRDFSGIQSKARAIRPYIKGQTFQSIGLVQARIKKEMLQAGLKPATINRRLALLRRLANLAYEWGWIDSPVGKRIKLLPGETERHYYLTMAQVNAIAEECSATAGLIKLAAVTGLRRSELLNLKPEQILNNEWVLLNTDTKNRKPRAVPIPKSMRHLLDDYHWPLDRSYNQTLRNEFEAARVKLKMPHIRFHDLRHSYASFLVQRGATLKEVGEVMGHSSTQMTNRYSHLVKDRLMDLADMFD